MTILRWLSDPTLTLNWKCPISSLKSSIWGLFSAFKTSTSAFDEMRFFPNARELGKTYHDYVVG